MYREFGQRRPTKGVLASGDDLGRDLPLPRATTQSNPAHNHLELSDQADGSGGGKTILRNIVTADYPRHRKLPRDRAASKPSGIPWNVKRTRKVTDSPRALDRMAQGRT